MSAIKKYDSPNFSWPTSANPDDCAFSRWWHRMGELFGRQWYEQNGPEPSELWKKTLTEVSMQTAAEVIEYYRRTPTKFSPNMTEVKAVAQSIHRGEVMRFKPLATYTDTGISADRVFRETLRRTNEWLTEYMRAHPEATMHDASIAYAKEIGVLKKIEETVPTTQEENRR